MAIASLTESLRQKTATLKQAVAQITQGNIGSSYKTLESAGLIHQTDNVANQVAQQYLSLSPKQQEKTLVIAGTNATRLKTVELIRVGLQAEGRLGQDRYEMLALRPRDLTDAQAKYAKNYKQGDVIVPLQNSKRQGLARGQQYEVLEIDVTTNRLMVQSQAGESRTIAPSQCAQTTLYEQQRIPLAINELLRWTRNDRSAGRRNGQAFRLLDVDEAGNAMIQYGDGTLEQTTLSGRQFVDSALVSTTYGSQGKTADRVIAIADGRRSAKKPFMSPLAALNTSSISIAPIAPSLPPERRNRRQTKTPATIWTYSLTAEDIMSRTKLGKTLKPIEDLIRKEHTTVEIEGSALEQALAASLQPLYGAIAQMQEQISSLEKKQQQSTVALQSLIERLQSQESMLQQLLMQLQRLWSDGKSDEVGQRFQTLLAQLIAVSGSLQTSAAQLQSAISELTDTDS